MSIIQARNSQTDTGGGQKWSNSEYILKVEPTGLAIMGCGRRAESPKTSSF